MKAHDPTSRDATTDLASVPPPLWGIVASYGLHTLPALLHDSLCERAEEVSKERGRTEARNERRKADRIFRDALMEQKVQWVRRWEMSTAVSVARYVRFARTRGALMLLQLVVAHIVMMIGIIRFGFAGFDARNFLSAIGIPLVASGIWLRDAGVVAMATAASVLIVPVLLLTWLVNHFFWVLSAVYSILRAVNSKEASREAGAAQDSDLLK